VNQKRRTRTAIVEAARRLLDEDGVAPTVAQAAEAALVSRTTAYRYFPTQESLLLEVGSGAGIEDLEALAEVPPSAEEAPDRAVQIVERLNRHVLDNEARFRTLVRLYQDLWLTAAAQGDDAPIVREGRRRRWLDAALSSRRDELGGETYDRLLAALSLLTGGEAVVVLRDVCQLGDAEAIDVTTWAARTLLAAALDGTAS
jgi:AcrR family transcriptional regulator